MALDAATPLAAGGAPPGFYIWKSLTERPIDCGNLLQMNCAVETEEWLSLLYKAPLFHWNAAALSCLTDIFSDAVLWQYSRDAGGLFSSVLGKCPRILTNQCIERMHRNSSYCPVSTKRNALDLTNCRTPDRHLNSSVAQSHIVLDLKQE